MNIPNWRDVPKHLTTLGIIYPYGIASGLIFQALRGLGTIKVENRERIPSFDQKIVIAANHPSMADPFLLSAMLLREYLFHPFQNAPLNIADKDIFHSPWYWFWLKYAILPVDRTSRRGKAKSFRLMQECLRCGRKIIFFPEGGRTFKGDKFNYSKNGNKMRILEGGLGLLAAREEVQIIPIWIDGSDKVFPNRTNSLIPGFNPWERIKIRIGEPMQFAGRATASSREEITQTISSTLLELSDE